MKAIYIDVQNVHRKTLDYDRLIDWSRLFVYLRDKYKPDIIYYAVGHIEKYKHIYAKLETIGYTMLFKKTIVLPDGSIKGNVDIDIAIQTILDLCRNQLDQAYIITNDGDYNSLIYRLYDEGVFGGLITPDATTASRLIKDINGVLLDLQDIKNKIQKTPTD